MISATTSTPHLGLSITQLKWRNGQTNTPMWWTNSKTETW
jgi:hypothetical protein